MIICEWWIGKIWGGGRYGFIKLKLSQFPQGTEENHNHPARTGGVPSKIHARHLLNTSLECYCYTNMLKSAITNCEIRPHLHNIKHQHADRAAQNTVTIKQETPGRSCASPNTKINLPWWGLIITYNFSDFIKRDKNGGTKMDQHKKNNVIWDCKTF